MGIHEFVASVVEGEGGVPGSLFVCDCDAGVGVASDGLDPDYTGGGLLAADVASALESAGFSVYTSASEWREQLNRWCAIGGGPQAGHPTGD